MKINDMNVLARKKYEYACFRNLLRLRCKIRLGRFAHFPVSFFIKEA
jgi:hypothetical protein